MPKILVLATAGLKPDQLADRDHRRYPRVDYLELQRILDIDILNYSVYEHRRLGNFLRRAETQLRSDPFLTLLGWRAQKEYDLVFAMSERAGIPFAALRRLAPHHGTFATMFQSWSWRQELTISRFNLFSAIDAVTVHCDSMKCHLTKLGAPPQHTRVLPYSVDHHFFSRRPGNAQEAGLILSVGEIRSRDYETLLQAIEHVPARLLVAASGSWYAREKVTRLQAPVPQNTDIIGRLSSVELRDLYARSQFVVLPIYDTVFSAGSTVITEAGCMERAVIATRSPGISNYIIDGETGILVEPNNPAALQDAICYLLAHPEEARRLGQNARQRIEEELNLDIYVAEMARFLQSYL